MTLHRSLIGALCALGLVACSAAAADPDPTTVTTLAPTGSSPDTDAPTISGPSTVGGVGSLPGPLPTVAIEEIASTTTLPAPEEEVGTVANGNRILLLGDSILASTSRRYTNNMCKTLVPLGWQVEVEAEVSRGIDFGQRVQKELASPAWDVGLIFLGNNYNDDQDDFFKRYNDVIVKFGDVPVIVVTVTEFKESQHKVNEIIRALAGAHPNVKVLEWASISEGDGVIASQDSLHLHLTDTGRQVLADAVANVLGVAPAQPGDCLASKHHDDSAGSVNGNTSGKPTGTTVKPTTTAKPSATTTSTATTSPGCQIPPCATTPPTNPPTGSTNPPTNPPTGSTAPPTGSTQPQPTTPPATSPPVTNPPATSPPATNPPATPPPATNPPGPTVPGP